MAAKAKPLPEDIGQVRIPGDLLANLYDFLDSLHKPILRLHQPILKKAVERAFARKSGPAAGRVNADDIVQAAQDFLPSSLGQLAECLKSGEARHGRK